MLNELAQQVHQNAKDKGLFDSEKNIGEMLCLIHSEVSEALEADRKNYHTTKSKILVIKPPVEEWKSLSFTDEYEVSNWGRIRSLTLKVWNGKVFYSKEGRIIKPGRGKAQYNTVVLRNKNGNRTHKVSRLVAEAFLGNVSGKIVNHLNGDKSCDWLTNLEITTSLGNNIHAIETGLREKINIWKKYDIAFALKLKKKQVDICKDFGVSKHTVAIIKKEGIEKYTECFEFEMVDIIIRVLDMCAFKGIDIDGHIQAKMLYNSLREHKHGGKKY